MNDLDFKNRIKKIIKLAGTAEKLANSAGVSPSLIGKYLSGKSDPTRKKLIALAEAAGVNVQWLATGEGLMGRNAIKHEFSLSPLTLIIEVLDDYEIELGKKLTTSERANLISEVYECLSENVPDTPETKTLIMDKIKRVHNILPAIDQMTATEEDWERAQRMLKRKVLSKADAEAEASELVDSRRIKRNEHLLKHRTKK